jgi:hypothetical protein
MFCKHCLRLACLTIPQTYRSPSIICTLIVLAKEGFSIKYSIVLNHRDQFPLVRNSTNHNNNPKLCAILSKNLGLIR